MKRVFLLFVLLLTLSTVGIGQGIGPITVREVDGSPVCRNCRTFIFGNGTLTVSGNTVTVSSGGGGGGSPGGSSGQFQFNDAGAFGGTTGVSYASSGAPTVSITGQSTSQLTGYFLGPNTSSTALVGIQLGTGGSSGNFVEYRNSSGTALSVVDSTGAAGFGITSSLGARLHSVAGGSGNAGRFDGAALSANTVLVTRQGGSSTGNLFEAQTSGGTAFFTIANGGQLTASLPVTTGTGATAGFQVTANSLTTGNGHEISSSSVSSGNVVSIAATGTAAASNTKTALSVSTSGANATSTQTTYAIQANNTSTGTSSKNVGLRINVSGATTNIGIDFTNGSASDASPTIAWGGATNSGIGHASGITNIISAGAAQLRVSSNGVGVRSASNTTGIGLGATAATIGDVAITRNAAAVLQITNGSTGAGSLVLGSSTVGSIGTSGVGVLAIANGTAPSSRPADEFQFYAADYAAGDSRANILSENNATPVTIGNHSVLTGYQHLTKTADYTVIAADSNVFFDNAGAGAGVVFTLPTPTASPSLKYTFCRVANQTVTVDIGGSVTIRSGANVTTPGGNVTLDAVGSCLTIFSVSSTEWYASSQNGTLTFN